MEIPYNCPAFKWYKLIFSNFNNIYWEGIQNWHSIFNFYFHLLVHKNHYSSPQPLETILWCVFLEKKCVSVFGVNGDPPTQQKRRLGSIWYMSIIEYNSFFFWGGWRVDIAWKIIWGFQLMHIFLRILNLNKTPALHVESFFFFLNQNRLYLLYS